MKKFLLLTIFFLAGLFAFGQYTVTDEGTAIKIESTDESLSLSKDGLIFQYILPKLYFISNDRLYTFVWTTIDSPECPTIDSLYTVIEAWLSSTTYTSITGDTITDGTWKTIAGVQTGLVSLTDGTASWTADQDLTGFDTITATGLLKSQGLTFPDPGTSASSGIITLIADNSTTNQTATIQNIYGADPYLKISAPVPSGSARSILQLHDEDITLFDGTTDVDYVLNFNGKSHDGSITYMEDEDRFDFDNALTAAGTITGGTLTDGTLTITAGDISSGNIWGADSLTINYLTDGTATLVGGDFSGGTVEGTTLTDGTLSISAGSITSGNVFNADSVHANWFGGSDFELGESGSDITIDADTIKSVGVINGLTSLTDGTATWNALHNLTGFNLIGADTVTANYFSGTVIGGLYWSDTTAAGGVGIATAFDIADMLEWADTTSKIATDFELLSYVEWSDTTGKLATDYNVALKQNISDTTTKDATRYWVLQQGYLDTEVDGSTTNEIQGVDYTASTRKITLTGSVDDAELPLFSTTATTAGLVPGSNTQATKYLKGDGTWDTPSGAGDITGITFTAPTSEFNVSGSPDTEGDVSIALTWDDQTTNKVFASPNGSTGQPTFRALVAADIPALSYLQWSDTTTKIATDFEIADMVTFSDTTTKIASQYDLSQIITGWTVLPGTPDTIYENDSAMVKLNAPLWTDYITNVAITSPELDETNTNQTNVILGYGAGIKDSRLGDSIAYSTMIGFQAGYDADTVTFSTFLGRFAGAESNYANSSTFLGREAGAESNSATSSTFLGQLAGAESNYANSSTFLGRFAGASSTYANSSTFLGLEAGLLSDSATSSTFLGREAGAESNYANSSTFLGRFAGASSTYANSSTFLGYSAGYQSDSATGSTFLGIDAGSASNYADYSTFLGYKAGYQSDSISDSYFYGSYTGIKSNLLDEMILIGDSVGYQQSGLSHQIWIDDSPTSTPLILGDFANDSLHIYGDLKAHGDVYGDTAKFVHYGGQSPFSIGDSVAITIDATYGGSIVIDADAFNTALGSGALNNPTISIGDGYGLFNVAVGDSALFSNTTGGGNSAFGVKALSSNTEGAYNSAFGREALSSNTTGNKNVAIGAYAGFSNTTDSANIFIGDSAGYNATSSNMLWIDNSSTATPLILGDFANDVLTVNGIVEIPGDGSPKFRLYVIADTLCSVRVGIDTVRIHPPRP